MVYRERERERERERKRKRERERQRERERERETERERERETERNSVTRRHVSPLYMKGLILEITWSRAPMFRITFLGKCSRKLFC